MKRGVSFLCGTKNIAGTKALQIKSKRLSFLWGFRICFSLHFFKLNNAIPLSSMQKVFVRSLPYSSVSQTALASRLGFFKSIFAKHGCTKPAHGSDGLIRLVVWSFTGDSQQGDIRDTGDTSQEAESPAHIFCEENAHTCSHCWM